MAMLPACAVTGSSSDLSSGTGFPGPSHALIDSSLAFDGQAEVLFGGSFVNGPIVSTAVWTSSSLPSTWKVANHADAKGWSGTLVSPDAGAYDQSINKLVAVSMLAKGYATWTFQDNVWSRVSSGSLSSVSSLMRPLGVVYDQRLRTDLLVTCDSRMPNSSASIWAFANNGWKPVATNQTGPSCSQTAGIAYDQSNASVVAYEGNYPLPKTKKPLEGILPKASTTWEWKGGTWKTLDVSKSSPNVYMVAFAYDPATSEDVLLGFTKHFLANKGFISRERMQTWVLRDNVWIQLHPASQPPLNSPAFGYDPSTRSMLLVGGWNPHHPQSQGEWTWSGSNWTHIVTR